MLPNADTVQYAYASLNSNQLTHAPGFLISEQATAPYYHATQVNNSLGYDSNGDVKSASPGTAVFHSFSYDAHHHLTLIRFTSSPYGTVVAQGYSYDGLGRIAETDCTSPKTLPQWQTWTRSGFPEGATAAGIGYGVCNDVTGTEWGRSHYYFYDARGRLLEELEISKSATFCFLSNVQHR